MLNNHYRISLWTPLPPLKTGIADYVSELLPYLDQRFDLEIFVDNSYSVSDELSRKYKIFPIEYYSDRTQKESFDLDIYQMGNNSYHSYIYEQALNIPGLVVLHDLSLSFMLYHELAGVQNNLELFKNEFAFSEGQAALRNFTRFYNHGDNERLMDFFSGHHMLRRLVGRSIGVVSHLDYAAGIVREKYGAVSTYTMYLGSPDPMEELPGTSKMDARQALRISDSDFVLGVFGHLQPNKQNDVVVRALAKIKEKHPNVLLVFVGEMNPALNYDNYIRDLINRLNLKDNVRLTGYVSKAEMQRYYLASDVVINLRYPSFGQMSASLSRGIATGRPAIITDLPEWGFFPDEFCWRVPPKDTEGKKLAGFINRLIENPLELEQRGAAARKFYTQSGTSQIAADNFENIVRDVIENSSRTVTLEKFTSISRSRSEMLHDAFEEWDKTRAGGKYRYWVSKLLRIPILGRIIFTAFVFLANLASTRKLRQREWSLNNAIVTTITKLENQNTNLENRLKTLEMETRSEIVLNPVRTWDDPLAAVIGYEPGKFRDREDLNPEEAYYNALEQVFRGSQDVIRLRQQTVLDEIKSYTKLGINTPIVDVGCGRGEFLSLLRDEGVHPIGVENNHTLIVDLRQKGFDVHEMDLFNYLSSLPDGTLKGITAFHVIEHLSHAQNMTFLQLAYKKLADGSFIYLETPNPLCPDTLGRFHTDPTHQQPIQPFQLSFDLEYCHFTKVRLLFLEPLKTRGSLSTERWITLYQDFGILATKNQETTL